MATCIAFHSGGVSVVSGSTSQSRPEGRQQQQQQQCQGRGGGDCCVGWRCHFGWVFRGSSYELLLSSDSSLQRRKGFIDACIAATLPHSLLPLSHSLLQSASSFHCCCFERPTLFCLSVPRLSRCPTPSVVSCHSRVRCSRARSPPSAIGACPVQFLVLPLLCNVSSAVALLLLFLLLVFVSRLALSLLARRRRRRRRPAAALCCPRRWLWLWGSVC